MQKRISGLAVLALLGMLSLGRNAQAQDPQFTQFYANPIYLNPALAGSHGCPRVSLNWRNQWPAITGTFVTFSASYDQFFKGIQGGIGLIATHDIAGRGTINTSSIHAIYSYHLPVNRKFSVLIGAEAGWFQKFLDWDKLRFGDQIDPRRGFIYATGDKPRGGSRGFFDVGAGIVGFTKNFYFGFAAHHLNMPDESMIIGESPMPIRMTAHLGANIELGKKSRYSTSTSLSPNIVWQYQQGFQELNLGMYVKHGVFTGGVWWREGDAFIVTVGLNTGVWRLGYSYDITISKLTNASGGSHELSMGFYFNCKKKPKKFRTISCPSF